MEIREALMVGYPSLVTHRAAQDEISKLDHQVLSLQQRLDVVTAERDAALAELKAIKEQGEEAVPGKTRNCKQRCPFKDS